MQNNDRIKSVEKEINVVCFGGEDWWYHNQAHIDMQLMRRFAGRGITLYINSIVMRKPQMRDRKGFCEKLFRKSKSILKGLRKSNAGFWVYSPFTLPVHHIYWARPINEVILRFQIKRIMRKLSIVSPLIWVACPPACDTAIKLKKEKLVYQRTDRYEDDPQVDRETILNYDKKLKANADITVYVNKSLYDNEADQCRRAFFLDHGVDYDIFASAQNSHDVPKEMVNLRKPVVGYFGRLADHKLDVKFVNRIIQLLPEFTFVFVGYASPECRNMFIGDNVRVIPKQPYKKIPHYGKCFDVAILPWGINKWTEAANPIKLKEYLALGKPVVSTPAFTELQRYLDVVYEAKTPEEFAECIKKAYSQNNPELIEKRRQKVANASWDSKAESMLREIFNEAYNSYKV